ncbi:MAG: NADH-quinone oxidoreductase subunit N [Deltaproteobacteria bacterium]|nr:MAG: NADH-quinone oxidoreductase subunit N [Deltaproteobacteria bacterium]
MTDLALISPYLIVLIMGLTALLVAVFSPKDAPKGWLAYVTTFGFLLALGGVAWLWSRAPVGFETHSFAHALVLDHFGLGLMAVILIGATLVTLSAVHYLPAQGSDHGEYYGLLAFSVLGMMAMVTAADLLTFFIALELMSISIYILAGFKRHSRVSTESALKYFILGSFASAILLLGIAFTYGATGALTMTGIGDALQSAQAGAFPMDIALLGMVMLLAAFFFKIAAAPFHMWTPDVYEGAPATAAGFMAIGVKVAAFGGFARLLFTCFGGPEFRGGDIPWESLIAAVSVLSMFAGNLMALAQKNLKRMLGYSAIAHTGYIMLALLVTPTADTGTHALNALGGGMIFYLLGYTLANAAAFGVAAAVSDHDVEDTDDRAYAGLAKRSPGLALALAIAMLSLLGIPLTAGFMGKLTIFEEVLDSSDGAHLWLIIVAVINSIISALYYLRVILVAYMRDEDAERPIALIKSRPLALSAAVASILTLALGVLPDGALRASTEAGKSLSQTTRPAFLQRAAAPEAASADLPVESR